MKKLSLYMFVLIAILSFNIIKVNADVTVSQKKFYLGINYSQNLTVSGNTSNDITWYSSNPDIVSVNNGLVTGKSIGTAYISVTDGYSTDICKISIISDYIPISNLTLSISSTTLKINETKKVIATITPSNASNKTINYYSSDSNIVSIDQNGYVTAKKVGTVYISASIENKISSYKITVVPSSNNNNNNNNNNNSNNNNNNNNNSKVSLKSISILSSVTIQENETKKLTVTYNPTNATNKSVKWTSSDTNIVTVDSNGNIKGISAGSASITVTSADGNYKVTSKITVNSLDKTLKSISLNKNNLNLEVGKSEALTVNYTPSNAENKNIKWTSSDNRIATVENGKVTAVKPGEVEIKATSEEGEKEAICKVIVTALPIESIAFETEEIEVYLGSTTELKTIPTPQNSAIINPLWTSSDETVATVKNGTIIALKIGKTTITVSDQEGKISASINVSVVTKPEEKLLITIEGYDLNFDPDTKNYTLLIGNETSLNIIVNRDESKYEIGGNRDLKNGSIITVTINGKTKSTYVINIKKRGNYTLYFIGAISILLFANIIRILIKNKKRK